MSNQTISDLSSTKMGYREKRDAYKKKFDEQFESLSDEEELELERKINEYNQRIYLEERDWPTESLSAEEVSDLYGHVRGLSMSRLEKTGGICPEVGDPLDFLKDDLGKRFVKK